MRKYSRNSKFWSLLKSISWRIVGTIDTMIVAFIVTGDFFKSFTIGGTEIITKILLYYFHERAWVRFHFQINEKENIVNK